MIIGVGAVGATVAAQFVEAGLDVVVVARGANLAALRAGGLRYIRPDGERRVALEAAAGPEEVELRAGDVLVLATKAQDTEALVAQWAWRPVAKAEPGVGADPASPPPAAEALPIVLLQNGIDSARSALRRFATVIDTVVVIPASHLRPGEVVSPGVPQVGGFVLGRAGRPAGDTEQAHGRRVAEQVAADLRLSGFTTSVVDDIARYKAGKLLDNLAYNLDAAFAPSPLRDLAAAEIVREARAVFAAAGIQAVEPGSAPGLNLRSWAISPIPGHERAGSSTWQSLARGGSVESDYLNGEIVLLARLHGLAAPVNAALARWIATAARTGAAPASLGEAELAAILTAVHGVARPRTRDRIRRSLSRPAVSRDG
ncbi:hypothetical protein I6A84_14250 [Frankia sp. CNm7]|uniref:ketopantoate reductase family protein n=1 Tax=Frankia nepalensis TaxID=1836974 RepID=UPI001932A3FE|nr:2-dehydropantoate 2-reductase N-terminal domain-containing protein [Frankia nepalensis]MBL7519235.1 hypothetical protein [Frankia nepalensis]